MAGALRIRGYAEGGPATAQPAVYSNGTLASSGNGALMLPGTPGNNPLASALPQLAGLPYLPMTPSAESQAFRGEDYGIAGSLLGLNPNEGDPTGVMGALSRVQGAEDTATAGKLSSINQAISRLQNLPGNNDAQMQNLAYRAGILGAAAPGTSDASWGAGDLRTGSAGLCEISLSCQHHRAGLSKWRCRIFGAPSVSRRKKTILPAGTEVP